MPQRYARNRPRFDRTSRYTLQLRCLAIDQIPHRRIDYTRADAVNHDPIIRQFQSQLLTEADRSMLAGGIYTERSALSWRHLSRPGSIDNNPPSLALADHLFRRRLAAQECTLGIYRHQPIPGLLVRIDQA